MHQAPPMAAGDLVVTDLDGTLWHVEQEVHPATVAALHQVLAEGPPLLVATGRRRGSTRRPLRAIGIQPPAVVLNGAMGLDLATDERFQTNALPIETAIAVLDAFLAVGLHPCLYVDEPDHEVVVSATPSTHENHVRDLGDDLRRGDLAQVVAGQPVFMFSIIGLPHGQLSAAAQKIGDVAEIHLDRSFDVAGMAAITVSPPGLSKWEGVQAWCRASGTTPTRVIALGDGPNDVELLANADLALVPEVAHPAALELADHVIPKAEDGGWAALLDHL